MATAETAATTASLNVQIDHMTEHDLLEVCQIEGLSDLSAWGWDAYHKELEVAPETVMLVARLNPAIDGIEVAGFIVARVIAGELHVNNVAVRPEYKRLHLGLELLERTLMQAKQRGAENRRHVTSPRSRASGFLLWVRIPILTGPPVRIGILTHKIRPGACPRSRPGTPLPARAARFPDR